MKIRLAVFFALVVFLSSPAFLGLTTSCSSNSGGTPEVTEPDPKEGLFTLDENIKIEKPFKDEVQDSLNFVTEYGLPMDSEDLIAKDLMEGIISEKQYFEQKIALIFGFGKLDEKYVQADNGDLNKSNFCGTSFGQEMIRYIARPGSDAETVSVLKSLLKPKVEHPGAQSDSNATKPPPNKLSVKIQALVKPYHPPLRWVLHGPQ